MPRGIIISILFFFLLLSLSSSSSAIAGFSPPPETDSITVPPPANADFPPQSSAAPQPNASTAPPSPSSGDAMAPEGEAMAGDMTWWCDKTPHPEPCKYYFKKSQSHKRPPRLRSEFRRMLVDVALDQAETTRGQAVKFGPSCTDKRRRAAWSDCVKLYDDTVVQLNRTLRGLDPSEDADVRCTDFDAQTWLSTAQTNIDTCRLGSEDLNVSDFVLPVISNKNLSDLISNCLAVNGALMKQHNNHTTGTYTYHYILN